MANRFGVIAGSVSNLPEVLRDDDEGEITPVRIHIAGEHRLDLLPTFRPASDPTELLSSGMVAVLAAFKSHYDVIVIDGAPLLPVADSLTIAPLVSGVVFVANVSKGDRQSVVSATNLLRQLNVEVLATVANQVPSSLSGMTQYGYGPEHLSSGA